MLKEVAPVDSRGGKILGKRDKNVWRRKVDGHVYKDQEKSKVLIALKGRPLHTGQKRGGGDSGGGN